MTVVCYKCKADTSEFEFIVFGNDTKPVCRSCLLVEKKEAELSVVMNDLSQYDLKNWS